MKKRILAVIAAACLLFTGCSGLTESLQRLRSDRLPDAPLADLPYIDPHIETPFEPQVMQFYYGQLASDGERQLYRAYLQFLIDGEGNSVYVKGEFTQEQVAQALYALQCDYPQFLTRSWGYNCTYYSTSGGSGLGVELSPVEEQDGSGSHQEELYRALSDTLAQAAGQADVWERQLLLYELLVGGTDYNTGASDTAPLTPGEELPLRARLAHTAYGALVQRQAVCDGYAYAFQLLCSYAGIPAATVTGMSQRDEGLGESGYVENHAWNLIAYGEEYYYCDPTWDDNGGEYLDADGGRVTSPNSVDGLRPLLPQVLHRYFNLSYEEMAGDHEFSPKFSYPTRTGQARDYYTLRELSAQSPGELERLLAAAFVGKGGQDAGFELRVSYPVDNLTEEIFSRLYVVGVRGTVLVGYTPNDSGCCYIFVYHP